MTPSLASPTSGKRLRLDGPHVLTDGVERWPVVDGIPYLRVGRDELVRLALACLDIGDHEGALVHLLADQDDWWDGPVPVEADLRHLVRLRDVLTLRDAMGHLAYGRVADYFAHRWSDPTFLAGLALIEAHWTDTRSAFELACGIGHYLRELQRIGVAVSGADVVFSKLWLARHWVVEPSTDLVCFDAAAAWPIPDLRADLVVCQDAFYFLEPKGRILAALRRVAGPEGSLAIGHVHNRETGNLSAGSGVSAADVAVLFPDGLVYDDDELIRAALAARAPVPRPPVELAHVEAFSIAAGPRRPAAPGAIGGRLTLPEASSEWRLNPLYRPAPAGELAIAWPSERYRNEYQSRATYPARSDIRLEDLAGQPASVEMLRRRMLVVLPERW